MKLLLGHTVAGWTGTALVVTGTTVAGIAFAAGDAVGLSCGLVIVAFGALAAWLLHLAGWGKATGPRPPGARHWRTRDAATRRGHPGCLGCRLAGRTAGAAAAPAPLRARERSRERAGARS
ncbi:MULTISPECIES: HGxxPAAW family protein [unclassified Kitasatospora]|uniref:HGxxPAAW family protein n=1 Tax=unclassified Kitasatospora TaxID=2633591 RepID=UPI00247372AC|nr:HGxxPAAW family protein [Kitasatospora sp. MAP12-44]